MNEASKNLISRGEYQAALDAYNVMEGTPEVLKMRTYLEFRCAKVVPPVYSESLGHYINKDYWFDGDRIEAEEAELRRLNFLAGRGKFTKPVDGVIKAVEKKTPRTNNQLLVNQYLEANGQDAELSEAFPDLSESTLKVYRYNFMKLCGTFTGRKRRTKAEMAEQQPKVKGKRTRTARGSGNQETVFAYLEANGHNADLSSFNSINAGSLAVYRSLFRKSKGIEVKRGRK